MGIEGVASAHYFAALSAVLPEEWKFAGRSRDPARDAFNCLLNYSYGVLYSHVEKGCIIAGLDPYVGLLHTDDYNKKSFVFDLIEVFRIFMDRTVLLFAKRQVKESLLIRSRWALSEPGGEGGADRGGQRDVRPGDPVSWKECQGPKRHPDGMPPDCERTDQP